MSVGAPELWQVLGSFAAPGVPTDDQALREASARIRGYCGWHIWPVITETIRVDSIGGRHLLLPTLRVVDVTSVMVDGAEVEVEWSVSGSLYALSGCLPRRPRSVHVTYEHGFGAVDDLASVARAWATGAKSPHGPVAAQASGPDSVSYASFGSQGIRLAGLSPQDRATLDRYRLPKGPDHVRGDRHGHLPPDRH